MTRQHELKSDGHNQIIEIPRLTDFQIETPQSDGLMECQGFFSAKPKIKLNMDMVDETQED